MPLSPSLATTSQVSLGNGACTKCDLCKSRTQVVNGFGSTQAKILFVTDTVSGYEENSNRPLQGMNGKLFDRLLIQAGLSRSSVFITQTVRCKGAPKVPKLLQISVNACKDYLEQEIQTIQPNVIVPIGSTALRAVLDTKNLNITKERGIPRYSEKYKCKVIPIFHPAYLMQVPHYEQVTVQDLCRIKHESKSPNIVPPPKKKTKVILTLEDFRVFLEEYKKAPVLAVDIETTGLVFWVDKVIGISFSQNAQEGYYIPLIRGNGDRSSLWDPMHEVTLLRGITELLEGPAEKIFHNGPFDTKMIQYNWGVKVKNYLWDTFIMDHLLDENARGLHGLENCALRFTDLGSYKQPVIQWFKDKKIAEKNRDYTLLPLELIAPYGCLDSLTTFALWDIFVPKLREQGLMRLFKQIVMQVQHRLIETEYRGVEIDRDYMAKLEVQFKDEVLTLEQKIYQLVGTFKITSPVQLEKVLFTQLKLPPSKKTKSGKWSTDKEVLKELEGKHPVIVPLQRYKLVKKLLNTYVIGMQKKLDPSGRLHTSYKVTGTTTGRLSSSGPNLQNIPARSNDIQNAFIAGQGRVFIAADFAQAEFRAWAAFCRDPQMLADCARGGDFDVHKEIASVVFKIPISAITKDQRNLAKTVLFGTMFGRGPASVAEQFKVPKSEAVKILDYVKRRYPVGFRWITQQQQRVQMDGEVKNWFGRIRHLQSSLDSMNEEVKAQAMRLCVNSPIQGTIGDLNSIATVRTLNRFDKDKVDGYLALTIHDALIFSVASTQQNEARRIIEEEMTRPVDGFGVPMFVDVKIGARWGEVRKMEDEEFKEQVKAVVSVDDPEEDTDEEDEDE